MHLRIPSMFAPNDRLLGTALGVSLVLHALALAVHFKFPEAIRWKTENQPLEVVLVNAKTKERPAKADVLAQANLDRGGNIDEPPKSAPAPEAPPVRSGRDLAD